MIKEGYWQDLARKGAGEMLEFGFPQMLDEMEVDPLWFEKPGLVVLVAGGSEATPEKLMVCMFGKHVMRLRENVGQVIWCETDPFGDFIWQELEPKSRSRLAGNEVGGIVQVATRSVFVNANVGELVRALGNESVDVITFLRIQGFRLHLNFYDDFFLNIRRVLKPGGRMVASGYFTEEEKKEVGDMLGRSGCTYWLVSLSRKDYFDVGNGNRHTGIVIEKMVGV